MKVLYLLRFDAKENGGGDVIHAQKCASFVEAAGGEAAFTSTLQPNALGFDLVHALNIDRPETYFQVSHLSRHYPTVPIILTPIHHSNAHRRQYEARGRRGALRLVNLLFPSYQFRESLKFFVRALRTRKVLLPALRFFLVRSPQKAIASKAVVALPQSKFEVGWCEDDYGIHFSRSEIIPNGFEEINDFNAGDPRDIDVIMIGRVESRKDHLSVLKALSGSGLKVVLVGAVNRNHRRYLKEVEAIISENPNFTLMGPRPHGEVLSLATRSKVYISTSWLETGCLGDLESFAAGCRVIASTHSPTSEILGSLVRYVAPGAVEDIRQAILDELSKQTPVEMSQRKEVLEKYLWKNLGCSYLQAYRREMQLQKAPLGGTLAA